MKTVKRLTERKEFHPLSPARTIAFSFASVILFGTLLFMLPAASSNGEGLDFLPALFTATSATCVTGLSLIDPYVHLSFFGQVVLAALIELGGIGLLTFANYFMLSIGKHAGLRSLMLARDNTNSSSLSEVRPLLKIIIRTALVCQTLGAALLMLFFVPKYGLKGLWISVFTAISGYCNAGFDILGFESPYVSLSNYNDNTGILLIVMALIFFGGIGFVVFRDILNWKKNRHLMLHTKVILLFSVAMILVGALLFFVLENDNPDTLGSFSLKEKINASFFHSVSARTAGFFSVDLTKAHDFTKVIMIFLMFIGAGPGSTAGGIKITTFAVLIATVISVIRGKSDTVLLRHKVGKDALYKAVTISVIALLVVFATSAIILYSMPKLSGIDGIFEAVSAFGTVGLSVGVSQSVGLAGKIALILTMFIGRIGPISFALAITLKGDSSSGRILPEGKILVC